MNSFEIINETNENLDEINDLSGVVECALKHMKIENSILNVIIVDEEKIRELNKNYRNKDSVTDVISFALEDDDTFVKTDIRILGDIYICLKRAIDQSIAYGHSLKRELSFLTVHGILHLLGYDHMNKNDEEIMFSLQEMILNEYKIQK